MTKIVFLPGASGAPEFWRPVAATLPSGWNKTFLSWPGLGHEPHDPAVMGPEDLVALVLRQLSEPADLVAQSMGGLVALKTVLQAPEKVRRLVLAGTSGGLSVQALGGQDWRPNYREEYADAAPWITEVQEDLSTDLRSIDKRVLLIWGDRDEISPLAVAERLLAILPHGELSVVEGGRHDVPRTHPLEVGRLVQQHLS
jgi:pimeloyl-ACP methyl ester carboxylesterase